MWISCNDLMSRRHWQVNVVVTIPKCRISDWQMGQFTQRIPTGWWFGTFFSFPYIGNSNPNWLIFFQRGWNHQPVMDPREPSTDIYPVIFHSWNRKWQHFKLLNGSVFWSIGYPKIGCYSIHHCFLHKHGRHTQIPNGRAVWNVCS